MIRSANSNDIKNFYNQLGFPGRYTQEQLNHYDHRPQNRYLGFMYDYLDHGQTVLDAGCGTGLITNVFASRFRSNFTGVDFANGIEHGQKYAEQHGLQNTTWIKQDLLRFEPTQEFDVVICQGVLHHIPEYMSVLARIKSWVKPQGILLLGLYNPWGKLLKQVGQVKYNNSMLEHDQESNPFEISFTVQQTMDLCSDMEFLSATPWFYTKYLTDLGSLFNSANGGLILYAFRR